MGRGWSERPRIGSIKMAGLYTIKFGKNDDSVSNEYMDIWDGISSIKTPFVVAVDSIIFAFTFSNDDNGVDGAARLLRAPMGTPNSQAVPIINESFDDTRARVHCVEAPIFCGDKLAGFWVDEGKNADEPIITFWAYAITDECFDKFDNLSGDFPSAGS